MANAPQPDESAPSRRERRDAERREQNWFRCFGRRFLEIVDETLHAEPQSRQDYLDNARNAVNRHTDPAASTIGYDDYLAAAERALKEDGDSHA